MLIKKSPLDLQDFLVTQNTFKFIPTDEEIDADHIFKNYLIDIEYSINTKDDLNFQLYVKIEVNASGESPGYSLTAEGVGIFLLGDGLSLDDKKRFLNYSALSICINNLRSLFSTITAHYPLGKYVMPAVDVNDLVSQKAKLVNGKKGE